MSFVAYASRLPEAHCLGAVAYSAAVAAACGRRRRAATGPGARRGLRDGTHAIHLAKRGWKVTAVDGVEEALAKARQRAAQEDVQVQWIAGDVSDLAGLGLEPGYTLLYDFGCIHGLPDGARASVLAGLRSSPRRPHRAPSAATPELDARTARESVRAYDQA
jgi:hypothetical protein